MNAITMNCEACHAGPLIIAEVTVLNPDGTPFMPVMRLRALTRQGVIRKAMRIVTGTLQQRMITSGRLEPDPPDIDRRAIREARRWWTTR